MEQEQQVVYVIDESMRKALLAIISKAVHPNVSFEQVDVVRKHLEDLKPVQVMNAPPPQVEPARGPLQTYTGPDTDGCGSPHEGPPPPA